MARALACAREKPQRIAAMIPATTMAVMMMAMSIGMTAFFWLTIATAASVFAARMDPLLIADGGPVGIVPDAGESEAVGPASGRPLNRSRASRACASP